MTRITKPRLAFATLVLGAAGLAVGVAGLGASPKHRGATAPIVGKALAAGTMQAAAVRSKGGAMVLESVRIAPGGNLGWHTHGSPVAVVVTSGTLTVFDPSIAKCSPFTVEKGQAFIEPANHVHLARNDGSTPATLYAMYLGVPKSAKPNAPAAEPAGCNA
jgi:quercetin dioxygenase-like cupin family protein